MGKIGKWSVYYRNESDEIWNKLKGKQSFWYADPILFSWNTHTYLFTEAFDEKLQIGRIAISQLKGGQFTEPETIIKQIYHLSYPCVFQYKSHIYMIPETSQNKTIELYEGEDNLKRWKKKGEIITGMRFVDSTVIEQNGEMFLYTYSDFDKRYVSYLFELNLDDFSLNLIRKKEWTKNLYRPAGKLFRRKGASFFPFQYNEKKYGEEIWLTKIKDIKELFEPKTFDKITSKELSSQKGINEKISRTHTYSYENGIEVIDCLFECNENWTFLKSVIRRGRNAIFKIIKKEEIKI